MDIWAESKRLKRTLTERRHKERHIRQKSISDWLLLNWENELCAGAESQKHSSFTVLFQKLCQITKICLWKGYVPDKFCCSGDLTKFYLPSSTQHIHWSFLCSLFLVEKEWSPEIASTRVDFQWAVSQMVLIFLVACLSMVPSGKLIELFPKMLNYTLVWVHSLEDKKIYVFQCHCCLYNPYVIQQNSKLSEEAIFFSTFLFLDPSCHYGATGCLFITELRDRQPLTLTITAVGDR